MARVLISMKDEFLDQVDTLAESEQRTRSELIREALRQYIRRNQVSGSSARSEVEARTIEEILRD